MTRRLCRFLGVLLATVAIGLAVPGSAAHAQGIPPQPGTPKRAVLRLRPGESGTTTIVLSNSPDAPVTRFVFTATNRLLSTTSKTQDGRLIAMAVGAATCGGTISAIGSFGITLWTWQATQDYSWNGTSVSLGSWNGSVPYIAPYWSLDHSTNVRFTANATPKISLMDGYFKLLAGTKLAGDITATMDANGGCTASGAVTSW